MTGVKEIVDYFRGMGSLNWEASATDICWLLYLMMVDKYPVTTRQKVLKGISMPLTSWMLSMARETSLEPRSNGIL